MLLTEGARREVLPVLRQGAELLPLDVVVAGLPIGMVNDRRGQAVTLSFQGHEVTLFQGKSLASIDGDLRLLSAPSVLEDGRWLLPVDAIPRLLGPLLDRPAEWRPAARVLILGHVSIPSVSVRTQVSGDTVRVVLASSAKLSFRVSRAPGRVTVALVRDVVNVDFEQQRLMGGIVDLMTYEGGREHLFTVALGSRFQDLQVAERDNPSQLVLDFHATPGTAAGRVDQRPPPPVVALERAVRTVVLDPGHGGSDVGARGPGGAQEKVVTLEIARRLQAYLVNNLGLQVFLTRLGDEELPLDQRTAIANNYKADLFISIHANSSRNHGARGSEVYFLSYQASDDEARRVALSEGMVTQDLGAGAPAPGSDLALILWDMAQAEHLEESSALASRIQEELAEVTGSETRGVKQAPFKVLVGAAMPAVLVEVAFISHPEEEKLLVSAEHQVRIAAALMRGVRRYENERARRVTRAVAAPRPGH